MGSTLKYAPLPMYYGKMLTVSDIAKHMGHQTHLQAQLLSPGDQLVVHFTRKWGWYILNRESRNFDTVTPYPGTMGLGKEILYIFY
jgi:hypothetical protein